MTPFSPFFPTLLCAAALSWFLSIRSWRKLQAPGGRFFAAMLFGIGIWCLFYAFEVGFLDLGAKTAFAELQYLGIATVPVFWVLFAMRFTGLDGALTTRRILLLFVIPITTVLLVVTNGAQGLMWRSVSLDTSGALQALKIGHGPFFWVWSTYSYLLLLGGVVVLIRAAFRYPRHYREQVGLIVAAAVVPWMANIVYATGLSSSDNLDPTPFAFAVTGGIIALALSRHRLLDMFLGLQSRARGAIFETMPDGVVVLDQEDRIIDCNPAAKRMLGDSLCEFISGRVDALRDEEGEVCPGNVHQEVQFSTGDEIKSLDIIVTSLGKAGVARSGRLIVFRDITLRRRAEQAALESERRYRRLIDNAHDLILTLDKDGRLTGVNAASEKATGYSRAELIGQTLADLGGTACPGISKELLVPFDGESGNIREVRLKSKDGRQIALEASVRGVFDDGELRGYECIARDVTESRQWEEALRFQALHDSVTSLPNRMHFHERIAELITRSSHESRSFAVYVLDLDQFKNINDSLGHQSGDALLEVVGRRLKGAIRAADMVARLGGDEFSLVVVVTDMDEARRVANRICDVFRRPFKVEGRDLALSASVGIAVFPVHGSTVESLLRFADIAMYAAKHAGGARYAVYSVGGDRYSPDRLTLQAELLGAFERSELTLHYQPLIDLRSGGVASVEALVRWNHPRRGVILPFEFLDLLEKDGLADHLAKWALDRALGQCAEWRSRGLDNCVSVNLSARNLDDPDLSHSIARLLCKHNTRAEWITVELTEGSIMLDPERNTRTISAIRDLGVRVSIDDFGAGQSGFSYLKRLPADEVKIDKSFILTMTIDKQDAAIVRSTIGLAHELGLSVVGEGIENEATLRLLRGYGCDIGQGFFLGRPESLSAASRRLELASADPAACSAMDLA